MPEVERCQCCGAVVLKETIFTSSIRSDILSIVRDNPGITHERLMQKVYGCLASDRSPNVLSVHVCAMNKKLAERGLRIASRRGRLYLQEMELPK